LEVLLNVGNGYGIAGLKLLRPLFERVVTMMQLIKHPDQVDDFLAYHHVHIRKTIRHMMAGGVDPTRYLTKDQLDSIEAEYQAVKARFVEVVCKTCGTTRDSMSWTKTDLATMARNVGLGPSYLGLCYYPTLQLHTTVSAMATRMEDTPEGFAFNPGAQTKEADVALVGAHTCLAVALEQHIQYFGLSVPAQWVRELYHGCWPDSEAG